MEVNSERADMLLKEQISTWVLVKNNYEALGEVQTRTFDMGDFTIKVQFNPTRLSSTGAKTDKESIKLRKCFLCQQNLPEEQIHLTFKSDYLVLCNPYPIFLEHFTIPTRLHIQQEIWPRFGDFLQLSRQMNKHTIFYNGPRSGASAPDHTHFQAVTRFEMPIDRELKYQLLQKRKEIVSTTDGSLYSFNNYLRNGFVIQANKPDTALQLFRSVYNELEKKTDEVEPGMNLFGYFENNQWTIVVIPRQKHRPWQYDAKSEEQILSSPGAADIGGLFITPRKEDFEKITTKVLTDIYGQVCYSNDKIEKISEYIHAKWYENHKL